MNRLICITAGAMMLSALGACTAENDELIQWMEQQHKEIKPIAGHAWAHLRFALPMQEQDTANDTWFTAFRGNILGVNLSAPSARWEQTESMLLSVIEQLRFNDTVAASASAASK